MADKEKQAEKVEEVEAPAEIAYYYLSDRNPLNAFIPGVPLCDLSQEVVDAQPRWVQTSIAGSPMYVKELPKPEKGKGHKE